MNTSIEMVALELLDSVPAIMSTIKMKWKTGTISGMTNLQFKILAYLEKKPGASLQDVAQDRALPTPTIASAVDDLVSRQMILLEPSTKDPQETTLWLSADGQKILHGIYEKSRADLEKHLSTLTADERTLVFQSLKLIGPLFIVNKEPDENIEIQKDLWKNHE